MQVQKISFTGPVSKMMPDGNGGLISPQNKYPAGKFYGFETGEELKLIKLIDVSEDVFPKDACDTSVYMRYFDASSGTKKGHVTLPCDKLYTADELLALYTVMAQKAGKYLALSDKVAKSNYTPGKLKVTA
jgi:hypothetical protein